LLQEIVVDEAFIALMGEFRKPKSGVGIIQNCSDNVVVFSERMLGIKLYSWQVYFLNHLQSLVNDTDELSRRGRVKKFLALTSRQIGKSTAVAIFSLWCAVFNKYPGTAHQHTLVGVVSATDVQARKLLYEIKKLIRTGDRHMESYKDADGNMLFKGKRGFFSDLLDDVEPNNTTTISFKGHKPEVHGPFLLVGSRVGSVIKSYPPTSIVLGETFTIRIEDEAGKSDKITDEFHYDYASPTTSATDGLEIYLSTPWTTSGFFYSMADPDGTNGSEQDIIRVLFTCEAIRLENPKQYARIQEEIALLHKDGHHDVVQRAYYCRFVKGENSYFNPQSILEMFDETTAPLAEYKKPCDMGIDYGGQVKSKTVITITTMLDDGRIQRLYHKVYPVGQDLSLLDDVGRLLKDFNVQRIIPDDCPAGDYLNRTMKERGWNVAPMNFRADKVKKYGAFRSSLNKGKVVSYPDDALKIEMLAMEFSQGARQSVIQHAAGYTDDLIDSFVMSCYYYVTDEGVLKFWDWGGSPLTAMEDSYSSRRRGGAQ
jgi:hypothetical protein